MKQFKCEICGGTSIIQIDEKTYECQDCGLQYDVAEVETLIVLPQEVVEEPAELTVEEQEDLQPTFDVPQELEDNFTEKVNAEQETEEIAVETDSETSPKYIENTLIESAESEDNDNSTAIEENPQSEAAEETADEISIIESEIDEAENVASEDEDKSKETEADEQEETVESSAIIPWYKNKKIIIPSIAGIALALVAVVLLIVLLPKGNVPVSDDNSSDIKGTIESSQVENTINSSTCESSVESNSSKNENINSSQNGNKKETHYYPSGAIEWVKEGHITTFYYESGAIKCIQEGLNPFNYNGMTVYNGVKITEYYESGEVKAVDNNGQYISYHENGQIMQETSNDDNGVTIITQYDENGEKVRCVEEYPDNSRKEINYYHGINGLATGIYEYSSNSILIKQTDVLENGCTYITEYDENGNIIKTTVYDEDGNAITEKSQQNVTDNSNSNVNSVDLICPLEKGSFQIVENLAPGIALVVTKWTQVRAAGSGTVTYVGGDDGYGMSVIIDHGDGLETKYINLRGELNVMKGAKVSQGTPIGSVGSDDIPSGNMFFLVAKEGVHVDPREYVDFY